MLQRNALVAGGCTALAAVAALVCALRARQGVNSRTVGNPVTAVRAMTTEPFRMVLHAKDATRMEAPFELLRDESAAGGVAVTVPPKAGAKPGALLVPFTLPTAGAYSIWVRTFWSTDGDGACSDSINVVLDSGALTCMLQDGSYEVWHWLPLRRAQAIQLTAGEHTLLFTNREDGIKFDQIFITPWNEDESARRIPQGIE